MKYQNISYFELRKWIGTFKFNQFKVQYKIKNNFCVCFTV